MNWDHFVRKVIGDRNVVFGLAFALGLILGEGAAARTQGLTIPALGVLIAVTASEVSRRVFRDWRRVLRDTGLALVATYVLNAAAIIVLARLLAPEPELYAGFALVAAAPPAVGGLGFSLTLRGDVTLSLIGTIGAHVAALAITPLLTLALVGPGLVRPQQLFILLVELIAIPLLLSRVLRNRRLLPHVRHWRDPVINWSYGLVIFTVVGVNRSFFFAQPGLVARVTLVAAAITFGLGALVEVGLRRLGVPRPVRVSLVLLCTLKNSGFAAAAALTLISRLASLPGAVVSVLNSLYLLWLGFGVERRR